MEYIINFFKNTLDGTIYFITVLVAIFLIFAIIGYLLQDKYTHMSIDNNNK